MYQKIEDINQKENLQISTIQVNKCIYNCILSTYNYWHYDCVSGSRIQNTQIGRIVRPDHEPLGSNTQIYGYTSSYGWPRRFYRHSECRTSTVENSWSPKTIQWTFWSEYIFISRLCILFEFTEIRFPNQAASDGESGPTMNVPRRRITRAYTEARPDTIYFDDMAPMHFNIPVKEEDEEDTNSCLAPPKVVTFILIWLWKF